MERARLSNPSGGSPFSSLTVIKSSGEDLLIGAGLQGENIRFEIQPYDFEVAPINTVTFSYLIPFSDEEWVGLGLSAAGSLGAFASSA